MADVRTLAERREAMWDAVQAHGTATRNLIHMLIHVDEQNKLPAHPVLWSRCRSLVLTEELTEWAWLHWFAQQGAWTEEKAGGGTFDALVARIVTPERQLVIDASTSLLAPNANASASIVPFTTVADSTVRNAIKSHLRRADAFSGLTTLPIPERLKTILRSGIVINRLTGDDATVWKTMTNNVVAPPDETAAALLDLLVNTGCTDTYTLLSTHTERAAFVAKLAIAIPADAPRLTFTD